MPKYIKRMKLSIEEKNITMYSYRKKSSLTNFEALLQIKITGIK